MSQKESFLDDRDKAYLADMKREMMKTVATSEDPASRNVMCKCGHRLSQHYMGTRAMPCSKCHCTWCTAPNSEPLRRQKARLGVQDITPHPEFERRRR